jgi:DNA repair protein RadD
MAESLMWQVMCNDLDGIQDQSIRRASFLIGQVCPNATLDHKARCMRKMVGTETLMTGRSRVSVLRKLNTEQLSRLAKALQIKPQSLLDEGYVLTDREKRAFEVALGETAASATENITLAENIDFPHSLLAHYSLFSHQSEIENEIIKTVLGEARGCMVHMPTGTGKTRTAMSTICKLISSYQLNCCWLTYSRTLTRQAVAEFSRAWAFRGDSECRVRYLIGGASIDQQSIDNATQMLFASFGRLSLDVKSEDEQIIRTIATQADVLFIDEAHEAQAVGRAAAVRAIRIHNPRIKTIGLSATPGRTSEAYNTDDYELSEMFDMNKITLRFDGYDNPINYLLDHGYMARPKYFAIQQEWGLCDEESMIGEIIGIVELVQDRLRHHKRIMIFCSSVEVSKSCSALLELRGYEAYHVDASTSEENRIMASRRFKGNSENSMALLNYNVLGTGFDAPNISCVLICRVVRSLVQLSQIIGRGLRGVKAGGTAEVEIGLVIPEDDSIARDIAMMFVNWDHLWSQ